MINLKRGYNTFLIYGDFTTILSSARLHLFNGFDKLDHVSKVTFTNANERFTEFVIYINDGIIADYHLNDLPYGNYDYSLNVEDIIYNRGQSFLAGDTEVQKVEYISDNDKSESVIYVS